MRKHIVKVEHRTWIALTSHRQAIEVDLAEMPTPAKQRRQLEVHIKLIEAQQDIGLFIVDGEPVDGGTQRQRIDLHFADHHLTAGQLGQRITGVVTHQTRGNKKAQQCVQQIEADQNQQCLDFPATALPCLCDFHALPPLADAADVEILTPW